MRQKVSPRSTDKKERWIILLLIAVLFYLAASSSWQLSSGFIGAFCLFVLLRRPMHYLANTKKWKVSWAASLLTLASFLLFLLPISAFILFIIDTITNTSINLNLFVRSYNSLMAKLELLIGTEGLTLETLHYLPQQGGKILQWLLGEIYHFGLSIAVTLFVLFYLLCQYKAADQFIKEMLPHHMSDRTSFVMRCNNLFFAHCIGLPLIALTVGFISYLGFRLCDVYGAPLYGLMAGVATVLPRTGALFIILIGVIANLIIGEFPQAMVLLLYGIVVVMGTEWLLNRWIARVYVRIHPVSTLLGVLVGLPLWGVWGVIIGPLMISILYLFYNLYRGERFTKQV